MKISDDELLKEALCQVYRGVQNAYLTDLRLFFLSENEYSVFIPQCHLLLPKTNDSGGQEPILW